LASAQFLPDSAFSFIVEKEVEGVNVPLPVIIQNVNMKSLVEISSEIERAKITEYRRGV